MSDLPAKQSAFARMRNSIVNAGLKNSITRSIMANTLPGVFGRSLIYHTLNNDDPNLESLCELLGSMSLSAVKANFSTVLYGLSNIISQMDYSVKPERSDAIINKILDSVDGEVAEYISLRMIGEWNFLDGAILDETDAKIADTIDCSRKTTEEINEMLEEANFEMGFSHKRKIAARIFENLSPEQKKTHFSQFINIISTSNYYIFDQEFVGMFEQFPPEDRLEQYKKILEVYGERESVKNVLDLGRCFELLSEEERLMVLQETYSQIYTTDTQEKSRALSKIISLLPSEEKDKYHQGILECCDDKMYNVQYYVESLDRKQQEEVVYDVISKLRTIKENGPRNESREIDIKNVFKAFEPEVINDALLNILNGDVESPDFGFLVNLLPYEGMRNFISSILTNGKSINPNQIELAAKKELAIEGLAFLSVPSECDRLVYEFSKNPNTESYSEIIQTISEMARKVKISDNLRDVNYNVTSEAILIKKEESIAQMFYLLGDSEKGKYFNETVNAILSLPRKTNDLSYNTSKILADMYEKLDEKEKIDVFPRFVGKIYKEHGSYERGNKFVQKIFESMSPDVKDEIFGRLTEMFNSGVDSEQSQTIRYILWSDTFVKGLIDYVSNNDNVSFLSEDKLKDWLNSGPEEFNNEKNKIVNIYISTRLNKIISKYNALDTNTQKQNIDSILMELTKKDELFSHFTINQLYLASELQINAVNTLFSSLDKNEKENHFETLYASLNSIKYPDIRKKGYINVYKSLDEELREERFPEFIEQLRDINQGGIELFDKLEDETKAKMFEKFIISSPDNHELAVEILRNYSVKRLNEIFKGNLIIDEETIIKLMSIDSKIAMKTLLFDKNVDREKVADLSSYEQLQTSAIDINSIIQNLYLKSQGKSKEEFNQLLEDTYNLFTYNNVPEFMKNFRMFQLGAYYEIQNKNITSFQGKTNDERDKLILEDLFKISLDSNNKSLRDFASIILEGKQLTTRIQGDPENKIKTLSTEEMALLSQYRDTLFDLHNLTKEIRKTDRPRIEKTGDILKDFRTLVSAYSDNKDHNPNSRNIIFNPNKMLDELFGDFITTTIRPKAMLEYMDRRKAESDERHLRIEQQLKDGTMHLEPGDFIKGVASFDEYIPSMLSDGVKGGEFNQEHSHSDATPLDADFGYVSKINIKKAKQNEKKEDVTDYEIIRTTISSAYGSEYIVLKSYADRLKDRSSQEFDVGTFTGSPDYYELGNGDNDDNPGASRYIRTGIPVTDIDYIVSYDWNPKNSYEMAMAGIYIPVVNPKGEVVFTSYEYNRIRDEMRGLSHYGADDIIVSKDTTNMDALYAAYRSISKKSPEDIDTEIATVQGLIEGKPDPVTEQKKKAVTQFIIDFFKTHDIRVTDDLSQSLTSKTVELIDTGSTGRGTNVPGDGDFDFMLRHNLPPDIISALADKVASLQTPDSKFIPVGDGFRIKKATLPTGEVVDIDVTTAKKSLALSYSSDMCVRDRLENIRQNDPEHYSYVQANIIMAKKILKAAGIYKKLKTDGATEHGGFGGIGVENWILQNGGSFKVAIDTFLDAAKDSKTYSDFKKKYPIFDFGLNQREGKIRHDRFSAFLENDSSKPGVGYEYVKATLSEIQKTMELETQRQSEERMETPLMRSISPEGFEEAGKKRSALRFISSYATIRGMVSKFKAQEVEKEETMLGEV